MDDVQRAGAWIHERKIPAKTKERKSVYGVVDDAEKEGEKGEGESG